MDVRAVLQDLIEVCRKHNCRLAGEDVGFNICLEDATNYYPTVLSNAEVCPTGGEGWDASKPRGAEGALIEVGEDPWGGTQP